ncbi:MAG: MBL fold metallo-hydrolase [Rhodopseudomonas palustris]|nr:MBL fold metallo-hydrolase [Rhodopseudomonas palustris]
MFDPLTAKETARAALELRQREARHSARWSAVIYSHSHVDHFGGVRGVVDEADVQSGKVPIIAPGRLHGARDRRERLRRQCDDRAGCSSSTACCCRAAPSATSTSRSARTPRPATPG